MCCAPDPYGLAYDIDESHRLTPIVRNKSILFHSQSPGYHFQSDRHSNKQREIQSFVLMACLLKLRA